MLYNNKKRERTERDNVQTKYIKKLQSRQSTLKQAYS